MNDDLHKTFEPEPVPDEKPVVSDSGGWKMPEPVFRRSSGRAGGPTPAEVPKAPSTIVPERLRKKKENAENKTEPPPPPDVEPQPMVADHLEPDHLDFSDLRKAEPAASKLPFGIAAVVIVALIGIVSALLVAVYLGYIVWR